MTTVAQIDLWRQEPSEHQQLEFKEAKNQYERRKLYEYCVAIANEGGGKLLLGIANGSPRTVVGTKAFVNLVSIAEDIFQNVGFRVDVEEVGHPDGRVLVFHIPSRMQGSAYHLDGKYLMRSGSSLTAMSEDRLRAIFSEGQPHWAEQFTRQELTAEQVITLLDTQTFFELLKQPYPTTQDAVLERLVAEHLIDESASGYAIRRLGALLLAKRLSEFPEIARRAPRVIVYNGISKTDVRLDQTGERGYAVGFQGIVDFVVSQLPQNEILEQSLRRKIRLLPDDAVRELIANALIHQDLTLTGMSPMVEIYSNRIEISNPGMPVLPVERFIDGYQSRNERLADLMRRMSICEERSSGVDRVVMAVEMHQLPAPYFGAIHQRTLVTIYGPRSFDDMDRDDRTRACYQHCALKWVMSERMTNQSLRERFGLPDGKQAIVSQIIKDAIDAKLIKPDESAGDSRRYARYLPIWA
ncbi:MAG TPA: ATP-binding protein [Candidatus Baltobacteraceae bacterium]|nr:ATP-binding protein [Candidatus Baltobacteraceae bacterium]